MPLAVVNHQTEPNNNNIDNINIINKEDYLEIWSEKIMKLIRNDELEEAVRLIDLFCLKKKEEDEENICGDGDGTQNANNGEDLINYQSLNVDKISILEKRCLLNLKLQNYDKCISDARKIISVASTENQSTAFKSLIIAYSKVNQLDKIDEVLKDWKKKCPNDLTQLSSRNLVEGLMMAVKNGIEPNKAFSRIEDLLSIDKELIDKKIQSSPWKYRSFPPGQNSFNLCLQFRFGQCPLNNKCPEAHGENELNEWKQRFSLEQKEKMFESTRYITEGSIYIHKLLALIRQAGEPSKIFIESPDIKITCDKQMKATVPFANKKTNFTWKFQIESKAQQMFYVCLLSDINRQYFKISNAFYHGLASVINLKRVKAGSTSDCHQELDMKLTTNDIAVTGPPTGITYTYSVEVVFTTQVFGKFLQSIVFDFGNEFKICRDVIIEVICASEDRSYNLSQSIDNSKRSRVTWNFGNAEIVDGINGERVSSEKIGFALINGEKEAPTITDPNNDYLTRDNYREKMRYFLTQEERARQEILAKYNVTTTLNILKTYPLVRGMDETKFAVDGQLFGCMNLFRDVSEDTAVGRLILRSCTSVLLTKNEDTVKAAENMVKPRVYLCQINDKAKSAIYIELGQTCVKELSLKNEDVFSFDIQFQLDRNAFIQQKKVIDRIELLHLDLLFPNFDTECQIPWTPNKQWNLDIESNQYRLNPKQKEALIAVTSEVSNIPPILIVGPWGTGKTFTLAQCVRQIISNSNTRVMICTHSNSSADLYIKEYFDHWYEKEGKEEAKPLRIYFSNRLLSTVSEAVLKYCTFEITRGKRSFRDPTAEEILAHRIIVVTLSTSYLLMDLKLPKDIFSHILLDEAAQAMESEAITPLMCAGVNTKLVLAGDYMQLSPELFSNEAKNFPLSLLERLHCSYPENHPCKLMLCENYRSHNAIIEFASDSFYSNKLECGSNQPRSEYYFPLSFFCTRGEGIQQADSTSYQNISEVYEVTERIEELLTCWPENWGNPKDESAIGVLTPYSDQVTFIRSFLRKKGLKSVTVERVFNVQGKQFRAVFLSTVRTPKQWVSILPNSVVDEVDLGFFSNPKLLNTALTRAQSLVAVVGDPVSLCSIGKCRRLWEEFIKICHKNNSLYGITLNDLRLNMKGAEIKQTWGFNPFAVEFFPSRSGMEMEGDSTNKIHSNQYQQQQQQQQSNVIPLTKAFISPKLAYPPPLNSSLSYKNMNYPIKQQIYPQQSTNEYHFSNSTNYIPINSAANIIYPGGISQSGHGQGYQQMMPTHSQHHPHSHLQHIYHQPQDNYLLNSHHQSLAGQSLYSNNLQHQHISPSHHQQNLAQFQQHQQQQQQKIPTHYTSPPQNYSGAAPAPSQYLAQQFQQQQQANQHVKMPNNWNNIYAQQQLKQNEQYKYLIQQHLLQQQQQQQQYLQQQQHQMNLEHYIKGAPLLQRRPPSVPYQNLVPVNSQQQQQQQQSLSGQPTPSTTPHYLYAAQNMTQQQQLQFLQQQQKGKNLTQEEMLTMKKLLDDYNKNNGDEYLVKNLQSKLSLSLNDESSSSSTSNNNNNNKSLYGAAAQNNLAILSNMKQQQTNVTNPNQYVFSTQTVPQAYNNSSHSQQQHFISANQLEMANKVSNANSAVRWNNDFGSNNSSVIAGNNSSTYFNNANNNGIFGSETEQSIIQGNFPNPPSSSNSGKIMTPINTSNKIQHSNVNFDRSYAAAARSNISNIDLTPSQQHQQQHLQQQQQKLQQQQQHLQQMAVKIGEESEKSMMAAVKSIGTVNCNDILNSNTNNSRKQGQGQPIPLMSLPPISVEQLKSLQSSLAGQKEVPAAAVGGGRGGGTQSSSKKSKKHK